MDIHAVEMFVLETHYTDEIFHLAMSDVGYQSIDQSINQFIREQAGLRPAHERPATDQRRRRRGRGRRL